MLPRAQETLLAWLRELSDLNGMRWLVPAHYSAPLAFSPERVMTLCDELNARPWAPSEANWEFLGSIDQRLLDLGVVPQQPLS